MLDSSARRSRSAAVSAVVLGLLLSGCSDEKKAAPEPAPTPIANLNTSAMQVPRIEFCGLVPKSAISAALDGKPDSDAAYGNGDEEELPGVGKDVVHEIGCSWTAEDGTTARAWVFARPINEEFARAVIASGTQTLGCRSVPGPPYGKPASTQTCRLRDKLLRVRHAGLFGQTWLTCELSGTGGLVDLRARADDWCVEVVNTLNTAH
jgi:hypothetical protein